MVTVTIVIVVVLSIGVVILAYNVLKENRNLAPGLDEDDDDELLFRD